LEDLEKNFLENFEKDKRFIKDLIEKWENVRIDPKFEKFSKDILQNLEKEPKRKIVIFSQYANTAEYLYENLKQK
jgi:ERCC4-related helicase